MEPTKLKVALIAQRLGVKRQLEEITALPHGKSYFERGRASRIMSPDAGSTTMRRDYGEVTDEFPCQT